MRDMKTETSTVTEEQVDDYIAAQYMAMRAGNLDSFTARLMKMGEEAEALGKGGGAALTGNLRATARWELEQA
jgi:hypothetical protein